MAHTYDTSEYQIPRGRVFFDPFDPDGHKTGERYLGNCPGLTVGIKTEKAEHYSSTSGLRQKDKTVVLQVDRTGTLKVDNMSLDNLALFISGDVAAVTQAPDTEAVEELEVLPGRYYQLGVSAEAPVGARSIDNLAVTATDSSARVYVEDEDYEVDEDLGRIHIRADGAIAADGQAETIECSYTVAAASWSQAATGKTSELSGALRFIADNATGDNRDAYLPSVTLAPTGEMNLVSDGTDFNAMEFELDILAPANGAAIYFSGRPAA